jgi:L-rhamnose isomerase
MELEQRVLEINEDLSRKTLSMEELRAGIREGKFALIGTWALRLPNGRKHSTPTEIGEAVAIFDDPEEGARAVQQLLRHWPTG